MYFWRPHCWMICCNFLVGMADLVPIIAHKDRPVNSQSRVRLTTLDDLLLHRSKRDRRSCAYVHNNNHHNSNCHPAPFVVPPMGSTCLDACVPAFLPSSHTDNHCCCDDDNCCWCNDHEDDRVHICISCGGECKSKCKKNNNRLILLPSQPGPPPLPLPIGPPPPPVYYPPIGGAPPPGFAYPPPPLAYPFGPPPSAAMVNCVGACMPECSPQCIQSVFPNCPTQCMPSCFSTCLSANQVLPAPPPPPMPLLFPGPPPPPYVPPPLPLPIAPPLFSGLPSSPQVICLSGDGDDCCNGVDDCCCDNCCGNGNGCCGRGDGKTVFLSPPPWWPKNPGPLLPPLPEAPPGMVVIGKQRKGCSCPSCDSDSQGCVRVTLTVKCGEKECENCCNPTPKIITVPVGLPPPPIMPLPPPPPVPVGLPPPLPPPPPPPPPVPPPLPTPPPLPVFPTFPPPPPFPPLPPPPPVPLPLLPPPPPPLPFPIPRPCLPPCQPLCNTDCLQAYLITIRPMCTTNCGPICSQTCLPSPGSPAPFPPPPPAFPLPGVPLPVVARPGGVPFFPSGGPVPPQFPATLAARIVHPPPMPLQPPIGLPAPHRDCVAACRPNCQPSCVDTCSNCVGLNGGSHNCPAFCLQPPSQFYPQDVYSQFQCAEPCMPSCASNCVRAYVVNSANPCYQQPTSPCVSCSPGFYPCGKACCHRRRKVPKKMHRHQFFEVGTRKSPQKLSGNDELMNELSFNSEKIDWEDEEQKKENSDKKNGMHSIPSTTFWLDDSTNIFVLDSGRKKSNDTEEDDLVSFDVIEEAAEAAQRVERHKGQRYSSPLKASSNFTFI